MSKFIRALISGLLVLLFSGCQQLPILTPDPIAVSSGSYLANPANVDPGEVSLNHLGVKNVTANEFKFLVIGHIYGTTLGEDRDPSPTLLAKIPDLNQLGFSMLVSLGDMVKHSEEEDFDILDSQVLSRLEFPVFNTVGNHDVVDRKLYENRYGQTFYSFSTGSAQMIFLDTERAECEIDDEQRLMVENVIDGALEDDQIRTIFIFMHKTLFFENESLFQAKLRMAGPNVWDCYGSESFKVVFENVIKPASLEKPVFLFAGDVGAWGNLSPYFEKLTEYPITMVMTGIGEEANDATILVRVKDEDVQLELYPLTDTPMMALESYTPSYWEAVK